MFFLVDQESKEVIARFASRDNGLTVGSLMAKDGERTLELRKTQGGEAIASFAPTGEIIHLEN